MRKLTLDEKITIRGYIVMVYGHTVANGQISAILKLSDSDLARFFNMLTGKSCLYAFIGNKRLNRRAKS